MVTQALVTSVTPARCASFGTARTPNPPETTWEPPAQKQDTWFFIWRHTGSLYPHTAWPLAEWGARADPAEQIPRCLSDCQYFISPLICFIQQQLQQSQRRRGHTCKKAINTTLIPQPGIFWFLFLQQKSQVFYPLPTQHLTHKWDTKFYSYFFLFTNRL